jgi:hypothetical protein
LLYRLIDRFLDPAPSRRRQSYFHVGGSWNHFQNIFGIQFLVQWHFHSMRNEQCIFRVFETYFGPQLCGNSMERRFQISLGSIVSNFVVPFGWNWRSLGIKSWKKRSAEDFWKKLKSTFYIVDFNNYTSTKLQLLLDYCDF